MTHELALAVATTKLQSFKLFASALMAFLGESETGVEDFQAFATSNYPPTDQLRIVLCVAEILGDEEQSLRDEEQMANLQRDAEFARAILEVLKPNQP